MTLSELQQQSGVRHFVSVLGKSTIATENPEYQLLASAVQVVLEQDFGVIHGGYAGGTMSAASDTAVAYLRAHALPAERNIGVPQEQHEGVWERLDGPVFLSPAIDVYDRLRAITAGDIALIAPLGGDGTDLEITAVIHDNLEIRDGRKPRPIIFLQTSNGTDWKSLIESKMRCLTTKSFKTFEQCPWILFATSVETFNDAFMRAQKIIK
jgi:hypothetical protein